MTCKHMILTVSEKAEPQNIISILKTSSKRFIASNEREIKIDLLLFIYSLNMIFMILF